MNWTSFLITLALGYMAYYGINLLIDLLISRKPPKADSSGDVLFFDEDVRPEIIVPADDPIPESAPALPTQAEPQPAPRTPATPTAQPEGLSGPIRSTGAVGLRELFNLAKDNLIEYTGDISYA
ncbi:hypothetical protein [Sphingobacterium sp. JB170]|uniref:hypothetical protein n=1 Tax=Sphingobacterium sp. JB170 TaxID=1434842 RepID=UPI00097F068B|nr:hypothetical protein [Sphingobacterium sp. JB170]SJN22474.1 hypothetical protein FM107_03340 [Sphingobacterium sp. JB170]